MGQDARSEFFMEKVSINIKTEIMSEQRQKKIKQMYEILEKVGKGAYGEVYKAINKQSNSVCALKKIYDAFRNVTDAQRTFRELNYLMGIRHPNIIRLLNCHFSDQGDDLYLELENMESDLGAYLQRNQMTKAMRASVFAQVVSAVFYLHSGNLIHRDIKTSNVLIRKNGEVKLCDFGQMRTIKKHSRKLSDDVGTRWYKAPELLLNGKQYGKQIDIWGLGCILAEMYLGKPIFQGSSTFDQLERIMQIAGKPHHSLLTKISCETSLASLSSMNKLIIKKSLKQLIPGIEPQAEDLLMKIFQFDPSARPNIQSVISHPYMRAAQDKVILKTKRQNYYESNYDEIMDKEHFKILITKIQTQLQQGGNQQISSPSPVKYSFKDMTRAKQTIFSPNCKKNDKDIYFSVQSQSILNGTPKNQYKACDYERTRQISSTAKYKKRLSPQNQGMKQRFFAKGVDQKNKVPFAKAREVERPTTQFSKTNFRESLNMRTAVSDQDLRLRLPLKFKTIFRDKLASKVSTTACSQSPQAKATESDEKVLNKKSSRSKIVRFKDTAYFCSTQADRSTKFDIKSREKTAPLWKQTEVSKDMSKQIAEIHKTRVPSFLGSK